MSSGNKTAGQRAKSFDFMVTIVFITAEPLCNAGDESARLPESHQRCSARRHMEVVKPLERRAKAIPAAAAAAAALAIYRTLTENSPFEV